MKRLYTEIHFEIKTGDLSFRRHESGVITGHFRADDGRTYHNTAELTPSGVLDSGGLYELLVHAFGVGRITEGDRGQSLDAIKELRRDWSDLATLLRAIWSWLLVGAPCASDNGGLFTEQIKAAVGMAKQAPDPLDAALEATGGDIDPDPLGATDNDIDPDPLT